MVEVAVRVDAPRPADCEGREVAGVRPVQRGRELRRLEDHVEADRLLLALDERSEPRGDRIGADRQVDVDRCVRAGLLERRLRRGDVRREVALDPLRRGEVRARRREREAARLLRAAEDDLVDELAVERELERLPQVGRLRERRADVLVGLVEPVLVPDVDRDALVADRDRLRDAQARVVRDPLQLRRRDAVLDVDASARAGSANAPTGR